MSQLIKEAMHEQAKVPCWFCTRMPPDSERGLTFIPWPLSGENMTMPISAQEGEMRLHQDEGEKLKAQKDLGAT